MKFFLLLLSFFSLSGCTHALHQYHAGDFRSEGTQKSRKVEAESEQFVIFFMTGNTDYVDEAYQKLLRTCPDGEIFGVQTRFSTSLGFLSYTNKIHIQAFCSKNG